MSDLISRSALLEALVYCDGLGRKSCEAVIKTINEQPTVEAKAVVHGEWISDLDSCGWINHTCSHCGYEKLTDIHVSLGWNFCPNCGCDMRGKNNGRT